MMAVSVSMTLPSLVPVPMLRRKKRISSFCVYTVASIPRPICDDLLLHAIYSAVLLSINYLWDTLMAANCVTSNLIY
ncbi:hypothetical protein GQ55_5G008100 [Panicum hallii var. hallii]|uniref:Uncharacterized protein n=1 Tax=Panicum hallii var. hallii TaxID=1504633 RepID=A0A2T7DB89_9POAL|nr:hypothetical protein GQ55_5G008100 [Panicum hallii var. hallii]